MKPLISLVAALTSKNRVIGKGNQLPWHIPEDLKWFKELTQGHVIVMGRKTWDAVGKPLPRRESRVVTRQVGFSAPGAHVYQDLKQACIDEPTSNMQRDQIFVVGGSEIYRLALPFADRLYLTLIEREYEGDAFFPEWDVKAFREVSRRVGSGEIPHTYVLLERNK